MRKFLDPELSLERANRNTANMRGTMTPGRRAVVANRNAEADAESARRVNEIRAGQPPSAGTWQGTGNMVYNKQTGDVKTLPKQNTHNGLDDGEMVEGVGRWSKKFGTFLDEKGSPVYVPADNGGIDPMLLFQMSPEQRNTYINNMLSKMTTKPEAPAAPVDKNAPGARWEVSG